MTQWNDPQHERNAELWRRHHGGETLTALAKEYRISFSRAGQIFHNIDRQVRRALYSVRPHPHCEPWVYDVWFEFRLGSNRAIIRPELE